MSKKTEEVRALEISYKQGTLALFEDIFRLITSAKAGEKAGVGMMSTSVFNLPRITQVLDDREAFMNARDELVNYADDLGALTADEAEIATLRRKLAELHRDLKFTTQERDELLRENALIRKEYAGPSKPRNETVISLNDAEAQVIQSALSYYRGHCDRRASNDEVEAKHFPRRAESLMESANEYRRNIALCDQVDAKIAAL